MSPLPVIQSNPVVSMPERIVIATRESRLALWQAEHVKARLEALYPACSAVPGL